MVPKKAARNEAGNLGPKQALCIFDIKFDEAMSEVRRIVSMCMCVCVCVCV